MREGRRGRPRRALPWSHSEYAVAAADAGSARAHRFHDRGAIERLEKGVELGAGTGQLDGVVLVGDVDDAPAEDVRHALHLLAVLAHGAHLDQHQLALDVVAVGEIDHLHHVDQLVELLGDLLDHLVGPGRDDGHPRKRRVLGGRDGERLDVVAARGEEARHARERAGLVLEEDGDDVPHTRIISDRPLPPGTIGNTFSVWSVMKSMNTRSSLRANASFSAGSTSPGFSILIPTCPYASASFTKSGSASMYDSA